ncbi:hypothetical protein [Nonomuraea solani]|uniref:hypothetical protein n=1 Tax=Nonomuraea solani TaxID=1144553 RepID=UPI0011B073FF|nr:hypothetical protein [Nonomuraea solani]
MTIEERALLLSIRPKYAEAIMAGDKSAELRRQRPGVSPGSAMMIYTTAPVAALTGIAKIMSISEGSPDEIWERHGDELGLSRTEFDSYLAGAATAIALTLSEPRRLSEPLSLQELREKLAFHPPQSFRYMTKTMIDQLARADHPDHELLEDLLSANLQQPLPT